MSDIFDNLIKSTLQFTHLYKLQQILIKLNCLMNKFSVDSKILLSWHLEG